jgi:hypothetical protein
MSPCDRSGPLAGATENLEYIENVNQKKALPSIVGMLTRFTEEDLKSVRISITGDKVNIDSSMEKKKGFSQDIIVLMFRGQGRTVLSSLFPLKLLRGQRI